MKKTYKIIEENNGNVEIYKSTRWLKVRFATPEYMVRAGKHDEQHPYFVYKGCRYYFGDIMRIDKSDKSYWREEFVGYHNDTYFSGFFIKVKFDDDNEPMVQVYEYCSVE